MTETTIRKKLFDTYFCFLSFNHILSANIEGTVFMAYTIASNKGTIKMSWLTFRELSKPTETVPSFEAICGSRP